MDIVVANTSRIPSIQISGKRNALNLITESLSLTAVITQITQIFTYGTIKCSSKIQRCFQKSSLELLNYHYQQHHHHVESYAWHPIFNPIKSFMWSEEQRLPCSKLCAKHLIDHHMWSTYHLKLADEKRNAHKYTFTFKITEFSIWNLWPCIYSNEFNF